MAMIPVFTLKLNQKILPRLVTVGKYDGEHSCITAGTNGNKVNAIYELGISHCTCNLKINNIP